MEVWPPAGAKFVTYVGSPEMMNSVAVGAQMEHAERWFMRQPDRDPHIADLIKDGFKQCLPKQYRLCTCEWEEKWKQRVSTTGVQQ